MYAPAADIEAALLAQKKRDRLSRMRIRMLDNIRLVRKIGISLLSSAAIGSAGIRPVFKNLSI